MSELVEVRGLRELREALLRKIPANMRGKVLQQALGAGSTIVVRDARLRAPKQTGVLRRAIFAARNTRNSFGVFEERVVAVRSGRRYQKSNRDAYYWRFVEFGTRFVPARSFLRKAFDSRREDVLRAIVKRLGVAIEKAAKKAAWGEPRR